MKLLRRTIIAICKMLECQDPKQAEFATALKELADEPVSSAPIGKGGGLMISKGTAFTTSHRHYSHMIGCESSARRRCCRLRLTLCLLLESSQAGTPVCSAGTTRSSASSV